jgi:hypothetical protein
MYAAIRWSSWRLLVILLAVACAPVAEREPAAELGQIRLAGSAEGTVPPSTPSPEVYPPVAHADAHLAALSLADTAARAD